MDADYGNGELLWDGDRLVLDVYSSDMTEIHFDLKGNNGETVTVRLMDDAQISKIALENNNGGYNYYANIHFISGDGQPHQVKLGELMGTGCDHDELIIGSGIDMTVDYNSIGASGSSNSYLTLEENAKMTFESQGEPYWQCVILQYQVY